MDIVVITSPHRVEQELVCLEQMIGLGINRIHLRKEELTLSDYLPLMESYPQTKWIIHTTGDKSFGEKYDYHLKANFREKSQVKPNVFVSIGVHRLDELASVTDYQYTFVSPVYPSISKPNYRSEITPQQWFEKAKELQMQDRVVPLGGIDFQRAKELKKIGFKSVALMGYLWQEPSKSIDRIEKIIAL